MRAVRPFLLLAALAVALAVPAAASADTCPGADSPPWEAGTEATVATTLCLLNEQRAQHGVAPQLSLDERLTTAAVAHSQDMVARRYFEHDSLGGLSFLTRIFDTGWTDQFKDWLVGENLAWGAGDRAAPRAIMEAWMNSPAHRENVLEPAFQVIGIGLAEGVPVPFDGPGTTYTTDFGGAITPTKPAAPQRSKAKRLRAKRQRAKRRARARRKRARRLRQRVAAGRRAGRAAAVFQSGA